MGTKRPGLRRALRKTVKWGGAVLGVALLITWVGSRWYSTVWDRPGGHRLAVSRGRFYLVESAGDAATVGNGRVVFQRDSSRWEWGLLWDRDPIYFAFAGPLLAPALALLITAAMAWRADAKYLRRAREGLCSGCGYDRAGLAPCEVCPECGRPDEAR